MFLETDFKGIQENAAKLIGSDWMLITAGTGKDYNTMTASWGGLGNLWNKPVSFIFVRPHRHTYRFVEREDYFSLCFFDEQYREVLNYCGSQSGRDVDKAGVTGLKAVEFSGKTVYFEQARLVLICRKIYFQDIQPGFFVDPSIGALYPMRDYHRMYIGEIVNTLVLQDPH